MIATNVQVWVAPTPVDMRKSFDALAEVFRAYVKRDFEWYEVLSRKMLAIVRELSPRVEFYSIDESFFTIHKPSRQDAQQLQ